VGDLFNPIRSTGQSTPNPRTINQNLLPPPPPPQPKTYSRELANLAKLYTNKAKYSGDNNNFNFKLTIFTDLCQKADIPKQEFCQAYSTILRRLALDHYYTNLKANPLSISFNKLYKSTHNYFKGLEYRRDILTQWNTLKLQTIINKNTRKSTLECL
jgi:hypothetical protein